MTSPLERNRGATPILSVMCSDKVVGHLNRRSDNTMRHVTAPKHIHTHAHVHTHKTTSYPVIRVFLSCFPPNLILYVVHVVAEWSLLTPHLLHTMAVIGFTAQQYEDTWGLLSGVRAHVSAEESQRVALCITQSNNERCWWLAWQKGRDDRCGGLCLCVTTHKSIPSWNSTPNLHFLLVVSQTNSTKWGEMIIRVRKDSVEIGLGYYELILMNSLCPHQLLLPLSKQMKSCTGNGPS